MKETGRIEVCLNSPVIGGHRDAGGGKMLEVVVDGRPRKMAFDVVVSAMYGYTNQFCGWFELKKQRYQYNLQELDVVEIPTLPRRIGITVQDGPFPSIIPIANTNRYLMAHVIASQLVREISDADIPLLHRATYVESNWSQVLEVCREYIPVLDKGRYIKSIFVDRVVDASRLQDDARLTDLIDHGDGCYSIFAAKVITCVTTARKLAELIRNNRY
jgi:hypothetical protein